MYLRYIHTFSKSFYELDVVKALGKDEKISHSQK